jgi:hypothetical protein
VGTDGQAARARTATTRREARAGLHPKANMTFRGDPMHWCEGLVGGEMTHSATRLGLWLGSTYHSIHSRRVVPNHQQGRAPG